MNQSLNGIIAIWAGRRIITKEKAGKRAISLFRSMFADCSRDGNDNGSASIGLSLHARLSTRLDQQIVQKLTITNKQGSEKMASAIKRCDTLTALLVSSV
jgi:hypothetical protein